MEVNTSITSLDACFQAEPTIQTSIEKEIAMRSDGHYASHIFLVVLLGLAFGTPLFAQDGKLKIHIRPAEAYVFVDGQAMGEAKRTLTLAAGTHKVDLYNYGYTPVSREVSIPAGGVSHLDVTLEAIPNSVSGPWGSITLEGADREAVLLNGKSPEFFVGHGDEFNHEWWWKQELIVPPGTHQVTVVREGKEIWSGEIEVPAHERVVVDIPKGVRKTIPWHRGEELTSLPRFKAGIASTTVALARPTAEISAQTEQINCGQSSLLKWSSTDATQVEISPIGEVKGSGEQSVQPKQTTTYELKASGPGGTATSNTIVNVNNSIQAQLGLSPAEIRYKRVGDKVVEEDSTALNWSASNADSVSIDPLGFVNANGNRPLEITPQKKDAGPVDETITYTLTATNLCGGSKTETATLHIVGSIEELEKELAMRSIYFPTDLPKAHKMQTGLVRSQRQALQLVADAFKQYRSSKPDARLILAGHADERGPNAYNQALSERRAQLAKSFLTEQGIPADKIETQAFGEERNLSSEQVKMLLDRNPDLNGEARQKAIQKLATTVYAHNRRVDITLSTTGQESLRQYPFTAEDFTALVKRGPAVNGDLELASEKEKVEY
jgi:outer membrane protein OmpA-like peptidoglycan-associated protein